MKIALVRRDQHFRIDLCAETIHEAAELRTLINTMGRDVVLDIPFRIESFGCDPDDDTADLDDPNCPIHSITLESLGAAAVNYPFGECQFCKGTFAGIAHTCLTGPFAEPEENKPSDYDCGFADGFAAAQRVLRNRIHTGGG